MQKYQELKVLSYVKKDVQSVFQGENTPKLLYVGKTRPAASAHPRIMHSHQDFLEMVLIVSGSGEYFVHDKVCHVEAGDLLIYNSGVVHDEFAGNKIEIGSYCIAISGIHMPGLRRDALISDDCDQVFSCGDAFEELRVLLEMMYRNLSECYINAEAVCAGLMHALLEKVLTVLHRSDQREHETLKPNELGFQIKEYIDEHYTEPMTLQSIANYLNFSPYYLSHVFKEMSGYSPIQYLIRRRIGEAQTLLITTDLPIIRIGEMVGYETQNYFNLQFTKCVGMPPKRFRQNFVVQDIEPKSRCRARSYALAR